MFHRGHCNVNFIVGFGDRDSSVGCLQIDWIEESSHYRRHGTTDEMTYHLVVGSDAGGQYSDRICSPTLSNPGLWLFLEMYNEQWEVCFWACTTFVA